MTEPRRSAYTRRPGAEGLVAAVVGVLLLVILVQLSASRCSSNRNDKGRAAPGVARPTSTRPVVPRRSSSASGQPSPSATPGGAASGPTGTPTAVAAGNGSAPGAAGPTPTGAPRTGGGSGLGMRNPALVAAGILMVFAAAALVLFRARPPMFDSDDGGVS